MANQSPEALAIQAIADVLCAIEDGESTSVWAAAALRAIQELPGEVQAALFPAAGRYLIGSLKAVLDAYAADEARSRPEPAAGEGG